MVATNVCAVPRELVSRRQVTIRYGCPRQESLSPVGPAYYRIAYDMPFTGCSNCTHSCVAPALRAPQAAIGQLAVDAVASSFDDQIERDIFQMLLGVDHDDASAHAIRQQLQQSQHTLCQQQALCLGPQHPQQQQHHASCSNSLRTQDAFAAYNRTQAFTLSTIPSADTETRSTASDFSHVHSTIDSPQTAKHSTDAHLQQQWSPANSSLQQPQSSNPMQFLPGNLSARIPVEQLAGSGWPGLISSDLFMTGMAPEAAEPAAGAAFFEHTCPVPSTAGPYYCTPVANPQAAPEAPAADIAALTDVCVPTTTSVLSPQLQQQRRSSRPPTAVCDAPSAAADATDGSGKRGRRSDSNIRSHKDSNSKKRQRVPPPGVKALDTLQHQVQELDIKFDSL